MIARPKLTQQADDNKAEANTASRRQQGAADDSKVQSMMASPKLTQQADNSKVQLITERPKLTQQAESKVTGHTAANGSKVKLTYTVKPDDCRVKFVQPRRVPKSIAANRMRCNESTESK
jgi:hypothetical protein